jgi:hypothetical protein
MSLSWTPEQKRLAKDGKKALVKLQVQLKHVAGGGNLEMAGPVGRDRALVLYLTTFLRDDDPRIKRILNIVQNKCKVGDWMLTRQGDKVKLTEEIGGGDWFVEHLDGSIDTWGDSYLTPIDTKG